MLTARHITAFFHKRSATVTVMVIAVACAVFAWGCGAVTPVAEAGSWGMAPVASWFPFGILAAEAGLTMNLIVALLTVYITRTFNLLRSLTSLVGTMYLMMLIATPGLLAQCYAGILLPLLVLVATALLFSIYADRSPQARFDILLIFLIISTASFLSPSFLLYIPEFLVGCVQKRDMRLKGFIA